MDRLCAGFQRRGDDPITAQVAVGGRIAPYRHGHISKAGVQGVRIGLGIDRNAAQPH
jgi:hypothetical protein